MHTEDVKVINPTNRWFNFGNLNRYELLLLLSGSCGIIAIITLAIISISNNRNLKDETVIFDITIIISALFCAIYLWRGIFEERAYELMAYTIAVTCLAFYLVIDFVQNYQKHESLSYINLGIATTLLPATAILGMLMAYNYNIHGQLVFRTVEGHERLQDDCKNLFVCEALLQMDCQFELSVLSLVLAVNAEFGQLQILVLGIGIPFSIGWHVLGYVSMRKELEVGVYLFLLTAIIQPAYTVYIIYNAIRSIKNAISEPIIEPVTPVVSITFAACFLAIIIRTLLVVTSVAVFKKFGNGLKDRLDDTCCDGGTLQKSDDDNDETDLLLGGPTSIND